MYKEWLDKVIENYSHIDKAKVVLAFNMGYNCYKNKTHRIPGKKGILNPFYIDKPLEDKLTEEDYLAAAWCSGMAARCFEEKSEKGGDIFERTI